MAWPGGSRRRLRRVIILDTNVLSALMRISPDIAVVSWLDRHPADSIWVTSVTVFEARFGLALLPQGRRRLALERAFEKVVEEDLANRVLNFDAVAAASAARLTADRQRAGRAVDFRDTLIAGIAQARRATIATRNTKHFEGLDVPVVDPWKA
jgi:toxin FitB